MTVICGLGVGVGVGFSFINVFFLFFFNFLCLFFLNPISRNLRQQCMGTTFSDIKKMTCSAAHLLGTTSPQTIRVTFQSRQSNIEAQISFLVQPASISALVALVEN